MARRRRHKGDSSPRSDATSQMSLTPRLFRPAPSPPRPVVLLSEVEDRRTHHPLGVNRPPRQTSGHPVKPTKVAKPTKARQLSAGFRFSAPEATVVCVRRKQRQEVLHAIKRTGKGIRRRRPRRTWLSNIGC